MVKNQRIIVKQKLGKFLSGFRIPNVFKTERSSTFHLEFKDFMKYRYYNENKILCQIIFYTIERLAWEHSYSSRLPALSRKIRFFLFFSIKVDPFNSMSKRS